MPREALDPGREPLVTGSTGGLAIALGFGQYAISPGRQVLPPLIPTIIEDLLITTDQTGFALTTMCGLFALVQYPAGRFSDQVSRKTVIVTSLSTVVAGCLVLFGSSSYSIFLIGVGLVGAGSGSYVVSMRAQLADLDVARRGKAIGLNQVAGNVGNIMASVLAFAVITYATWNSSFIIVSVILAFSIILYNLRSSEEYVFEYVDLSVCSTVTRLLSRSELRLLLASYTLAIFAGYGSLGFLPTVLEFNKGFLPGLRQPDSVSCLSSVWFLCRWQES
jgi:MFS family permease